MTCNDCLHVKICQKARIMDPTHNYAIECNDFKDRSRFVELPCKIGDTVYFGYYLSRIKQYKIDEWIVAKISFINYHLGNFF